MFGFVLIMIGIVLIIDDLWLHFLGDLTWVDMGSPFHHWMLGVVFLAVGAVLFLKETKTITRRR